MVTKVEATASDKSPGFLRMILMILGFTVAAAAIFVISVLFYVTEPPTSRFYLVALAGSALVCSAAFAMMTLLEGVARRFSDPIGDEMLACATVAVGTIIISSFFMSMGWA